MKLRPVGSELFTMNGRTDEHDEVNNCFSESYESD